MQINLDQIMSRGINEYLTVMSAVYVGIIFEQFIS